MSMSSKELRNEVNSIINDINRVTRELQSIVNGLNNEFKGIGTQNCASSIQGTVNEYNRATIYLRNIK